MNEWPLIAQIPVFLFIGTALGVMLAFIPAVCVSMDSTKETGGKATISEVIWALVIITLFLSGYAFAGFAVWTDKISGG